VRESFPPSRAAEMDQSISIVLWVSMGEPLVYSTMMWIWHMRSRPIKQGTSRGNKRLQNGGVCLGTRRSVFA
jgi:hypothetical protein